MKCRLVILCLVLAAAILVAGVAFGANPKPYDPNQVYRGGYGLSTVYYRQTFRAKWRLGLVGAFPKAVTCPDALSHFKVSGLWKGHIKLDGSCGPPDEPSEWALGNRLNYDATTGAAH
jgi:hypothetical protein